MLSVVLATLRQAGRPLCLADLSRETGLDEGVLEGMVGTLVARGRLRAIRFDDAGCTACPVRGGCFIMNDGVAVTYALTAEAARDERERSHFEPSRTREPHPEPPGTPEPHPEPSGTREPHPEPSGAFSPASGREA